MGSDDKSAAALAELTERLQRLRLEKRLSMTSLETRAGLGHTTVSQALNGSVPSEATVIALARALRVAPEPLLALRSQAASARVKETTADARIRRPDDPYPRMEPAGPEPSASQGLPIPQQLPAGTSVFVGREGDLAALDAMLAGSQTGGAVVIGP